MDGDKGNIAGGPGVVPPETLVNLQRLKIWDKLKKGELHAITKQNVLDLFNVLDQEEKGEIAKDDLFLLRSVPALTLTEDDVLALADDCDKDGSGKISSDELFKALTQGELAFSMVKESLGKNQKAVDERSLALEKVIGYLDDDYETNSALWSLPQTIVLFVVFLFLMSKHLDITTAYSMQGGLLNEIEGEGPPYLHHHEWAIVHDVPTVWQWMDSSFVSLHFKNNDGDLDTFPYPGRVASYHQIVGGIQLVEHHVVSPEPCAQNPVLSNAYDSGGGRCHRSENTETKNEFLFYHDRLEYIHEHIQNLTRDRWIDQNTTKVDVNTLFYNAHLTAFTNCNLTFDFQGNGLVKVWISMETFQADPYYVLPWAVMDLLFVMILVKMLYQESKELIPAARNGLDGLKNYAEFWNLVDWVAIILGVVVIAYWGVICSLISGPLQEKITAMSVPQLDALVLENRTYLDPGWIEQTVGRQNFAEQIDQLHQVSNDIAIKHEELRLLVFWYAFVLMMKFFKAFQANPRLDIVIRTLTKSAVEIIHFLIVFSTIFVCFSSAGYVVFGKAIRGFKDQYQAMFMCWRILMGEFDIEDMEMVNYYYTFIWMVSFQFMVLLILLNMLLAIIMDTYVAAKQEAGEPSEQLTIWTQVKEACYTVKETHGHMPSYTLLLELQDEDYPAHTAPIVTSKSLRRAFQKKMSKHQADYIMRKTVEWIKSKDNVIELGLSDTVRILSLLKVNVLRNVGDTQQILDILRENQSASQQAAFDAIMAGDAPQTPLPQGPGQAMVAQAVDKSGLAGIPGGGLQMGIASPLPGAGRTNFHGADSGAGGPMAGGGFGATAAGGAGFAGMGGQSLPPGTEQMLGMLGVLQAGMSAMRTDQEVYVDSVQRQLAEQKQYIEERDAWLEQRINALERRCEKVERGNEKVLACLQGVDFADILQLPGRIEQAVRPAMMGQAHRSRSLVIEDDPPGDDFEFEQSVAGNEPEQAVVPRALRERGGARNKQLEAKLENMSKQVEQLVAQADETAEQRKLLWKIDLGIRQLRQEGLKIQAPVKTPTTAQSHAAASMSRVASRNSIRENMRAGGADMAAEASSDAEAPGNRHVAPPGRLPAMPNRHTGERVPTPPDLQNPRPNDITPDRG